MLVNCNSCQKKFIVPDAAITKSGRLVQCGSCGSKWTQYPIIEKIKKVEKIIKNPNIKKKRAKKNLYSPEYLQKKHGLVIKNSNDAVEQKTYGGKTKKNSFGFYSYLIILFIFLSTLFGILHLTKQMIIQKYPFSEIYIDYFYDVINIIKTSILLFLN
tara:strand:- start:252 stop:725 length:474 start_codon:yes stop_codon:yes gene_type:complete